MSRFTPSSQPWKKPFAWSYSKLKNYEACPFRHQQIDLLKTFAEGESPALVEGNVTHDVLAKALTGTPLPATHESYGHWVEKFLARGEERLYVELKLAITREYEPCDFFDKRAWFRGVIDFLKLLDVRDVTIGVAGDWKTGKIVEDSVQLALSAVCAFAHYPTLTRLRTEFIWLKDDVSTREDWSRKDMGDLWVSLAPRIEALEWAYTNDQYPPRKNGLCRKYCVVESCPNYRK